jgi:hypothetical protein
MRQRLGAIIGLGVEAELRARAHGNDVGVGCGRANGVRHARVPAGDHYRRASAYHGGVRKRNGIVVIVRQGIATERLVDHVHIVVDHGILDGSIENDQEFLIVRVSGALASGAVLTS